MWSDSLLSLLRFASPLYLLETISLKLPSTTNPWSGGNASNAFNAHDLSSVRTPLTPFRQKIQRVMSMLWRLLLLVSMLAHNTGLRAKRWVKHERTQYTPTTSGGKNHFLSSEKKKKKEKSRSSKYVFQELRLFMLRLRLWRWPAIVVMLRLFNLCVMMKPSTSVSFMNIYNKNAENMAGTVQTKHIVLNCLWNYTVTKERNKWVKNIHTSPTFNENK